MSSARRRTAAAVALSGAISAAVLSTPAVSAVAADGAIRIPADVLDIRNSTSGNWSGYVATGGGFSSVAAGWVEPAVACGAQTAYSSFWIGLDGDGSSTVEQIGTEADCSGGSPVYAAWYEMYPGGPVQISGAVSPGDVLHASVAYDGSGRFTLVLADHTKGWSRTFTPHLDNPALASAEVVAEAPSDAAGVLPLSDFRSVAFSGASANGTALGSFHPDPITMASGGATKATPGPLSSGGDFSITWQHS
jgi:hypothetical protein